MAKINQGSNTVLLQGISEPVADTDAANKKYVDDNAGGGTDLTFSGGLVKDDQDDVSIADDGVTGSKLNISNDATVGQVLSAATAGSDPTFTWIDDDAGITAVNSGQHISVTTVNGVATPNFDEVFKLWGDKTDWVQINSGTPSGNNILWVDATKTLTVPSINNREILDILLTARSGMAVHIRKENSASSPSVFSSGFYQILNISATTSPEQVVLRLLPDASDIFTEGAGTFTYELTILQFVTGGSMEQLPLGTLQDVTFSAAPNDNEVLTYDLATSTWSAQPAAGGSTLTAGNSIDITNDAVSLDVGFRANADILDLNTFTFIFDALATLTAGQFNAQANPISNGGGYRLHFHDTDFDGIQYQTLKVISVENGSDKGYYQIAGAEHNATDLILVDATSLLSGTDTLNALIVGGVDASSVTVNTGLRELIDIRDLGDVPTSVSAGQVLKRNADNNGFEWAAETGGSDTTYDLTIPDAATTSIRLAGSDGTNDDVTITGGTNVTVTRTSATELTIAAAADGSATSLNDLTDVSATDPDPGYIIRRSDDNSRWEEHSFSNTLSEYGNIAFNEKANVAPTATGTDSFAISDGADAQGEGDIAIGRAATASGEVSIALGESTTAAHRGSVALGDGASTTESSEIRLGNSSSRVTIDPGSAGTESSNNHLASVKYVKDAISDASRVVSDSVNGIEFQTRDSQATPWGDYLITPRNVIDDLLIATSIIKSAGHSIPIYAPVLQSSVNNNGTGFTSGTIPTFFAEQTNIATPDEVGGPEVADATCLGFKYTGYKTATVWLNQTATFVSKFTWINNDPENTSVSPPRVYASVQLVRIKPDSNSNYDVFTPGTVIAESPQLNFNTTGPIAGGGEFESTQTFVVPAQTEDDGLTNVADDDVFTFRYRIYTNGNAFERDFDNPTGLSLDIFIENAADFTPHMGIEHVTRSDSVVVESTGDVVYTDHVSNNTLTIIDNTDGVPTIPAASLSITGGDGITASGGTVSVDLVETNPSLNFTSGELEVNLSANSGIVKDSDGLQVRTRRLGGTFIDTDNAAAVSVSLRTDANSALQIAGSGTSAGLDVRVAEPVSNVSISGLNKLATGLQVVTSTSSGTSINGTTNAVEVQPDGNSGLELNSSGVAIKLPESEPGLVFNDDGDLDVKLGTSTGLDTDSSGLHVQLEANASGLTTDLNGLKVAVGTNLSIGTDGLLNAAGGSLEDLSDTDFDSSTLVGNEVLQWSSADSEWHANILPGNNTNLSAGDGITFAGTDSDEVTVDLGTTNPGLEFDADDNNRLKVNPGFGMTLDATGIAFNATANQLVDVASGTGVGIGNNTTSTGTNSLALGQDPSASATSSTAVGHTSTASGIQSTAVGFTSTASGSRSAAYGSGATASALNSTAFGYVSNATSTDATALGHGSNATGIGSLAAGADSLANHEEATAVGAKSSAQGDKSIAIGSEALVGVDDHLGIAIGERTRANNTRGIAIGSSSNSALDTAILCNASGANAIAMGRAARAFGTSDIAIGNEANANLDDSIAIGSDASALGVASVAIGNNASVAALITNANAIGNGASVTASNRTVIGTGSSHRVFAGSREMPTIITGSDSTTGNLNHNTDFAVPNNDPLHSFTWSIIGNVVTLRGYINVGVSTTDVAIGARALYSMNSSIGDILMPTNPPGITVIGSGQIYQSNGEDFDQSEPSTANVTMIQASSARIGFIVNTVRNGEGAGTAVVNWGQNINFCATYTI